MANGQAGDHTARAVSLVNQELNLEQEPARENYTEEKIVPEMTKTQKFVTPMSSVQFTANGHRGQNIVRVVSIAVKESNLEQEHAKDQRTVEMSAMEMPKKHKSVILIPNVQLMGFGLHGENGAAVARHVAKELKQDQDHVLHQSMVGSNATAPLLTVKVVNSSSPVFLNQFARVKHINWSVSHA